MPSIQELSAENNALIGDFLLIESELAMSFLDRAEDYSAREDDRERRLHSAVRAYKAIMKLLPRTTLAQEQHEALMSRLTVLHRRLNMHGMAYHHL